MTYNILVIDDDPNIIDSFELITGDLENCNLFSATKFYKVAKIVEKNYINLAFVDIVLPDTDGYEACKELRKHPNASKTYYILMSADKNHLLDRIRAYKVGAQEFLHKPFDLKEAELIIRSKIEYFSQTQDNIDAAKTNTEDEKPSHIFTSGKFLINGKIQRVTMGSKELELSSMEYSLLKYFIYNSEKLLEIGEIVNEIWGDNDQSNFDNARGLIYRLRVKIEPNPKTPVYIVSKKYTGYMFYPSGMETI